MKNKIEKIRKRDGVLADFDQTRITQAIFKALTVSGQGDGKLSKKLSDKVVEILNRRFKEAEIPTVEQVQDIVEEVLILEELVKAARAYIIYREQRRKIREAVLASEEAVDRVDQYLGKLDWEVQENANMTFSLQGLNHYGTSYIVKKYWLNKIYTQEIREANEAGDFHIHNLDTLATYCAGWDLYDLLLKGFRGVPGKIEAGPAKHFRAVLGQTVNFLYTLQGETAGAVAFSNFDTLLAPFIRYDNLDYYQTKQALQEFLYNMAIPTRVGFQCPFSNITLDLRPSSVFASQPVIIGGQPQKETYGEFAHEMKMFDQALYEVMLGGDKFGRPFHFPIPTINITKDFPWDDSAFNFLFEATAKYGTNYFANYINSEMKPEDVRSMCPLDGKEKVLIKSKRGRKLEYSSIRYIYEGNAKENKYEIYSDGQFVKGRFNSFPNQKMIKVTLQNGHEIRMSEEHLNYVMENPNSEIKELKGKELKKGIYLPYSLNIYPGEGGNKDLGYFVGAYAGDGSFNGETTVIFSLENEKKKEVIRKIKDIAEKYFGVHCTTREDPDTKLFTLKVHSQAAVGLCKDFVNGKKRDKYYKARIFGTSVDFRKGVLEGHYATDGGNRNRIYTSSKKMVETLNMLAVTLGTVTSVYKDDREGRLGKEANYAVRTYQFDNDKYGDFWFKHQNKIWMQIKNIEKINNSEAYCFEVENGEPIFTVGTTGVLTHNCRLRLDLKELHNRGGGGLFGSGSLTGSIGVVTVNLPRIGYLSKTKREFFERLGRVMDLAQESLEIKRKTIENFIGKGLYPYSRFYLAGVKKMRDAYYANHFSTIGLVGMNEALLNFLGENIGSPKGKKFTLEVMDFMREKLIKYQEETGNIYNLEATPAESTAYRLALSDKEKYPDIVAAGTKENPYYTNSTQLPVNFTDDIFEALNLQDEIQCKYTGGSVLHLFLGERVSEIETAKRLIKKVFERFHLPYITLTPTFSICPTHGYLIGEHWNCPKCTIKQPCEVYSRVVGYYRPVQQFNVGKQEEFRERKEFEIRT